MTRGISRKEPLPKVGHKNRIVVFIPVDGYIEDYGFRVAFVKEGEGGYFPSGNWPCDYSKGHKMPWFWGHSYEEAQRLAEEYNEQMGVSKTEAALIIADSIARRVFP